MEDQTDSDVDNGSVPPTLPNLLTLADQQGDDDEKTIGGLSEGDYDDVDDGDNIGTLLAVSYTHLTLPTNQCV